MVDFDNIVNFLSHTQGAYTAAGVGSFIALATGYLLGDRSSKKVEEEIRKEHELERERLHLSMAKISLERAKLNGNPLESQKIAYEEKEKDYQRKKELDEITRKRDVEDVERLKSIDLENITRQDLVKNAEREYHLNLVREMSEIIKPLAKIYAETIEKYNNDCYEDDGSILVNRREYRNILIDEYFEEIENGETDEENGDDSKLTIGDEIYDLSDDVRARMERIVSSKYPLSEIRELQMPKELKDFFDLFKILK